MATDTTLPRAADGLRRFVQKGGLLRLLVVVGVYLVLYLGSGWLVGRLGSGYVDDDLLSSIGSVFFQLTVGLIVGAVILTAFTALMGWNAEIFGRQPLYRSGWMWIAPVLVALPIVLRVLDIDWGGPVLSVVLLVLASGLLVGYVEELLFRGIAVKMLRDAGHRELSVAALSSLVFGLSHGVNALTGQDVRTVGTTMVYTVAFGALMYLTMRATGFIVVAMVLHGLTDPTTFLASGGIDTATGAGGSGPLGDAVGVVTVVMIVLGLVLLLCVRGVAREPRGPKARGRT